MLVVMLLVAIISSAILYLALFKPTQCDQMIASASYLSEPGYSYACGDSQVTDGRISITVHNYHFARTRDIQFRFGQNQQAPLPDEVFLLANVTVANVGGGNMSMGGGWFAWIFNGTKPLTNTMFIANATFPNNYPNETIPDLNGGLFLAPGARIDLWVFFYVRFSPVLSSDIMQASGFVLHFVTFNENSYGGIYLGGGQYDCQKSACQRPSVELIVRL